MAEYINREEAIKELREVYENEYPTASGDFDEYASHDVPNVLRNIKPADVQPMKHWISVKDRLPKTGESVLVYIAINKNLKGFGECKPEIRIGWLDDGDKWALQFSSMKYSEVLCWMPLPKPPKDGDTE